MIDRNCLAHDRNGWIEKHLKTLEPVVNYHAARLARTCRSFRHDEHSIAGELWQAIVRKSGEYNSSKASPRTFARLICQRKIISILLRAQKARMRGYGKSREFSAFDTDCRIETNLDETTKARHRGYVSEDRRDLKIDVTETCNRLPPRLRRLAEKLQTLTPREAAKKLRLSDEELAEQLEAIRKCFQRADLDRYHST